MTDIGIGGRPVIALRPPAPAPFQPVGGGNPKVKKPSRDRQGQRLGGRFAEIERLLGGRTGTAVTAGLPVTDPELVIVFEVLEKTDTTGDLAEAFRRARLEPLLDVEGDIDDEGLGDDFARVKAATERSEPIKRFLHAAMANEAAVAQLLSLWRHWQRGDRMRSGFGAFTDLFNLLHDVRPWGPADRVRATGLPGFIERSREANLIEVPVAVELWYRASIASRAAAEDRVSEVVRGAGGRVLRTVVHPEIGLHAMAVEFPTGGLDSIVANELAGIEEVALLQMPEILFVRPGGQSVALLDTDNLNSVDAPDSEFEEPTEPPLLAMIDGLPAVNHPLLRGRLDIVDPDDVASDPEYTVARREHGTQVASALVWGDLGSEQPGARRRVVARPVLRPDMRTHPVSEAVPWSEVPADLTIRAVRDLLGDAGAVPSVRVINLALGDPLAQFDTVPSAWARAIDWLSYRYRVLFVVSAGNHPGPLPIDHDQLRGARPEERDELTATALGAVTAHRRLLPPAESLNALTVGALHQDAAGGDFPLGYRADPWSTPGNPSPVTAHGRGIRRAIKPDLSAPGGRQLYDGRPAQHDSVPSRSPAQPPGVRVASPPDRVAYAAGTTFAAAEVSRRAARLMDSLLESPTPVDDEHLGVAAKALLVHGASFSGEAEWGVAPDRLVGNGILERDLALGCGPHQATLIYTGDIGPDQQVPVALPFPAEVAALRTLRRLTLTLAWLSPINWNHHQYRRAKLWVDGPSEIASSTRRAIGPNHDLSMRGTVQQRVITTDRVQTAENLSLIVKCAGQAGRFEGTVPYALAISLEVGADVGVDVYDLVAAQVRSRVRVG